MVHCTLTIAYTPFNKPASITGGTTTVAFDHDPEHQRFSQLSPSGVTHYVAGGGVFAERFAGVGVVLLNPSEDDTTISVTLP